MSFEMNRILVFILHSYRRTEASSTGTANIIAAADSATASEPAASPASSAESEYSARAAGPATGTAVSTSA